MVLVGGGVSTASLYYTLDGDSLRKGSARNLRRDLASCPDTISQLNRGRAYTLCTVGVGLAGLTTCAIGLASMLNDYEPGQASFTPAMGVGAGLLLCVNPLIMLKPDHTSRAVDAFNAQAP